MARKDSPTPPGPWMAAALAAARRAWGTTSPNPPVGAVLVRDGEIVGVGWTQPPGGPHAEIVALRQAGERARGAELYVTLEPCNFHGRTPPCADALLAAGVRAVHVALRDPNPRNGAGSLPRFRAAGIATSLGEGAEEALELLAPFLTWILHGRPWVTYKYAATLDGKTAAADGSARWISGPESREEVHRLRARVDAVLVGAGTVLRDDPQLTARPGGTVLQRQPLRVVLDGRGRIPPQARVCDPGLPGRTLVVTGEGSDPAWRRRLEARGVEVQVLPDREGWIDPARVLALLGEREVTHLLLEGGGETAWTFLAADRVDEVWAFLAPRLIGGRTAPTPLGGEGWRPMEAARRVRVRRVERRGEDLWIQGWLRDRDFFPGAFEEVEVDVHRDR